ncbi:competence protein CoiA family protein [Streptomyces sp. NPDC004520]|uniref:competence protein CoiA family protein n=1 Tax=Streptomyces sp. NPDC004520 TaxID=3364702 RepID=UPI00367E1E55
MTPYANEEDTRKVQTAVLGRAGSDDPVFLPYDHDEFDLFMRGRSRDDFYCGTLLGGCGKKLSAKRYTEKKCHFAHRPPVHCRRTANGESSADHLYIGQALTRWLARQNHRQAKASYRAVGDRPGGTVDFRLSGGRQLIRVQMARLGLHPWRQEAEGFARGADHVEWLFGPDSMLAFDRVESHGYAIRVECRTVGATREVRIGTQLPGNTVEWTTLSECTMTRAGIVTPSLTHTPQGIVPRASAATAALAADTAPTRLSFRLADDTVAFTGAEPRTDVRPPTGATPGRVYDADIQPLGSAVTRARVVLPLSSTTPHPSRVYSLRDRVTLTPLASDTESPAWLLTAAQTRRLDAREAAAWSGLKPVPPESVVPATAPALAPVRTVQPTPAPVPPQPSLGDPEIVASFRQTLERTARVQGRVTWSVLTDGLGVPVKPFTPEHRLRLLVALDFPRAQDKPVLSSLIESGGAGPAPYFADVLVGLGWAPGLVPQQVERIHQEELRRAYELCGGNPVEPTSQLQAGPRKQRQTVGGLTSPTGLSTLQLVLAVREHLKARAKNGAADITWRELSENTGFDFGVLSDARRAHLLFRVDEPLDDQGLMYAALVVADDGKPLPYLSEILQRHGRPAPGLQSEAHWARRLEADRVRDAYAGGASRSRGAESAPPAAATAPAPTPVPEPSAAPTFTPAGSPVSTSVAAAIGTLTGLRRRFDHARQVGDLPEAKRAWQEAGKLYGTKLPPVEQAEYRPHLREMSEWVRGRENELVQGDLRRLLDDLGRQQGPAEADALRDGLARAKELKRKHHGKLPQDLQDAHRACGERLAELPVVPPRSGASSPVPEVGGVPRPVEAKLTELATVVRSLLEDTARNRSTLTWSAIRHRLNVELPHLHPDDQGQVLVLADASTPADEPLLSALVTTNQGDLHPLYRHVAYSLGRETPLEQDELHARWQMDVLRLYGIWKHRSSIDGRK